MLLLHCIEPKRLRALIRRGLSLVIVLFYILSNRTRLWSRFSVLKAVLVYDKGFNSPGCIDEGWFATKSMRVTAQWYAYLVRPRANAEKYIVWDSEIQPPSFAWRHGSHETKFVGPPCVIFWLRQKFWVHPVHIWAETKFLGPPCAISGLRQNLWVHPVLYLGWDEIFVSALLVRRDILRSILLLDPSLN